MVAKEHGAWRIKTMRAPKQHVERRVSEETVNEVRACVACVACGETDERKLTDLSKRTNVSCLECAEHGVLCAHVKRGPVSVCDDCLPTELGE